MPKRRSTLTLKEELTLKDYLNPNSSSYLNATQSVLKHYHTSNPNSAKVIGSKLVKDKLTLIDSPVSNTLKEKLTPEWILSKLTDEVELKAKRSSDRIRALELIGSFKDLSLWKQNISQETTINVPESENDLDKEFRELISSRDQSAGPTKDTEPCI